MKRLFIIIIPFLVLLSSCSNESTEPNIDPDYLIKSGTSFGFCAGYCTREIEINDSEVTFIASSRGTGDDPDLTLVENLTSTEWNSLLTLIDMDALLALDDVIGCPDCADGGAEWIQVMDGDTIKKITFEFNDSLETIQPLLDKLRVIRNRMNDQVFP